MQAEYGLLNGFYAVRYSNGKVFFRAGGIFFQAIGQEHEFIPVKFK